VALQTLQYSRDEGSSGPIGEVVELWWHIKNVSTESTLNNVSEHGIRPLLRPGRA